MAGAGGGTAATACGNGGTALTAGGAGEGTRMGWGDQDEVKLPVDS